MRKRPRTFSETDDDDVTLLRPSPLWRLITDHPMLFSANILPKLDKPSVKLFYETTRATRRTLQSADNRNVYESVVLLNNATNKRTCGIKSLCSSKETLKWCFERYLWGHRKGAFKHDPREGSGRFCRIVASTNKLELLKYAREEAGCEWDERVLIEAGQHANYEMLKYCIENGCPLESESTYLGVLRSGYRAKGGDPIACLRYLRETVRAPWYDFVLIDAIEAFQGFNIPRDNTEEENEIVFEALKYVLDNGCRIHPEEATSYAVDMVNQGEVQFKAFKYLVEEAKVIPLNSFTLMRIDFFTRLWALELSLRNVVVGEEPLLTEEQYARNCRVGEYLREKGCPQPTSLDDEFLCFREIMASYKDEFVDEHAENVFWNEFAQFYGFDSIGSLNLIKNI
jgi:hypothetical protein